MKTKLTALILIAVMALQFTACGKKNDDNNISSLPSEAVIETIDTPETPNTPDTTSTPPVSKLTDTDTDSENQSNNSSSASKAEKKNSSSPAVSSKDTNSKNSSSAVSSKAASSKAVSSKAPTTVTTTGGGNGNTAENNQNTVATLPDPEPVQSTPQQTPPVVSYYEPEPTPQPTPEPEPQPEPDPEPEPPVIDSPYARPFDVDYIRNYMIDYGLERGLILDESLNIDNAAWSSPTNTRWYDIKDYVRLHELTIEMVDDLIELADYLGATPSDVRFNVQIVEIDEYPGEYRIYVPYGSLNYQILTFDIFL